MGSESREMPRVCCQSSQGDSDPIDSLERRRGGTFGSRRIRSHTSCGRHSSTTRSLFGRVGCRVHHRRRRTLSVRAPYAHAHRVRRTDATGKQSLARRLYRLRRIAHALWPLARGRRRDPGRRFSDQPPLSAQRLTPFQLVRVQAHPDVIQVGTGLTAQVVVGLVQPIHSRRIEDVHVQSILERFSLVRHVGWDVQHVARHHVVHFALIRTDP
jgi:hypothetical protein